MIYFSSLLQTDPAYKPAAARLFAALVSSGVEYQLIDGAHDIWIRDFMPVRTRSGVQVSFKYEPGYLKEYPELKTDYRRDIDRMLDLSNVFYSTIKLDGGNVVFSPSQKRAVISDRVFFENPGWEQSALIRELSRILETEVIIIPSLPSDMTGHADGMVRFVDENTVIGNCVPSKNGLEQRIKAVLQDYGIDVIDFPYFSSPNNSAIGCYLNFLETERHIFLPVFGNQMDDKAIASAKGIFTKRIVPVNVNEIAKEGGLLNCISWETKRIETRRKIKSESF